MIKIKEAIIVEGRYDKIRLSSIFDTLIIETGGFRIFKDSERRALIKKIAQEKGIIIFTDSDSAGFVIRNFLKGTVPPSLIKNAYIPQISGKEKRKSHASKEFLLGVEGVSDEIIIKSVLNSGAELIDVNSESVKAGKTITKNDLYFLNLTGGENSSALRKKVLKYFSLPSYITTNSMLSCLNILTNYDELKKIISEISDFEK